MKRIILCLGLCIQAFSAAYALDVNITQDLEYIDVIHDGKPVRIMRNQDIHALVTA